MPFPYDALNARADISGNSTTSLVSIPAGNTYTILYESFNTSSKTTSASLTISCDTTKTLQVNDFADVSELERFKMAKCTATSTDLSLVAAVQGTSGSPITTVQVIYTPYDVATSSPYVLASTSLQAFQATTSSLLLDTHANLMYAVALLVVVASLLAVDLLRRLFAPHTRA